MACLPRRQALPSTRLGQPRSIIFGFVYPKNVPIARENLFIKYLTTIVDVGPVV